MSEPKGHSPRGQGSRRSSLAEAYRAAAPYLSLGVEFAGAVLICLFAGRWLDQRLGTEPFLMLGGVLLGVTAGFIHFFRAVGRIQKDGHRVEGKRDGGPEDRGDG